MRQHPPTLYLVSLCFARTSDGGTSTSVMGVRFAQRQGNAVVRAFETFGLSGYTLSFD